VSAPLNRVPEETGSDEMVFGTHRSRLALAMERAAAPADQVTFAESEATFTRYRQSGGLDNPYGAGLEAYEPNTLILDQYAQAYGASQQSKLEEAGEETLTVDFTSQPIAAGGQVGKMIDAAMDLARRAVPYVWGGTTRNGVDCSGLIFYAAQAAGIPLQRYRAVDYGRMGVEVGPEAARPGDIVYYDHPNTDTDHVGIYIGGGKVIQAPQTGDHVRVTSVGNFTSIRRIFDDNLFGAMTTPGGDLVTAYNGRSYSPWMRAPATVDPGVITRTGGAGRARAF
jgi:cell wall-associated NlpC family hydrolase